MKPNPANYKETMDILQEECGEVIVEVSKCRRFGLNSTHYKTGLLHSTMLENEIGDVLAMVDILVEQGIVSVDNLNKAKESKKEKLTKWSTIYEN
jgi:NTP pyrophosphatase (non-canonical NTP hydrolase)